MKDEFKIEPKPLATIPAKNAQQLAKQKLEPIENRVKKEPDVKVTVKDALPIIKQFLINEALVVIGGKGFGVQFYVRVILILLIILGIIFL